MLDSVGIGEMTGQAEGVEVHFGFLGLDRFTKTIVYLCISHSDIQIRESEYLILDLKFFDVDHSVI